LEVPPQEQEQEQGFTVLMTENWKTFADEQKALLLFFFFF
jgi:hypothetical protein